MSAQQYTLIDVLNTTAIVRSAAGDVCTIPASAVPAGAAPGLLIHYSPDTPADAEPLPNYELAARLLSACRDAIVATCNMNEAQLAAFVRYCMSEAAAER